MLNFSIGKSKILFTDVDTFKLLKTEKKKIIGIDWGKKHLGLSISDSNWIIATPLKVLGVKNLRSVFEDLKKIIEKEAIAGMVIGWPINMNGSQGFQCHEVEKFSNQAYRNFKLPILKWDERLSSKAVTRIMVEADLSRKRQNEVIDKLAASYMLQGCLDFFSYNH